ncbi:hypothetical protein MWN41_04895 [Ornithobacterium rhinotracheale]|uniref:hypothetical protein n=1 Tax=Ornithobacterium rhinotracheale TaxID=28251 RepID=UPI001FF6F802|nr:hypothetical protein [Ornithobacterium rhinotracheale]MCK0202357.1 hypothetical protein [Ornithobacterium rhinotracheale]
MKRLDFLQNELKNKDLAYFENLELLGNPSLDSLRFEVIHNTEKPTQVFSQKSIKKRNFNIIKSGLLYLERKFMTESIVSGYYD